MEDQPSEHKHNLDAGRAADGGSSRAAARISPAFLALLTQNRRYRKTSVLVSLLIHAFFLLPLTALLIFDIDDLGGRGGRQWAEEIALSPSAGGAAGEQPQLAADYREGVAIVTLIRTALVSEEQAEEKDALETYDEIPEPESSPLLEAETPVLPQGDEGEQAQEDLREEEAKEMVEESTPAAPAGEIGDESRERGGGEVRAALAGGRDILGSGAGGADKDAQGLFVSGDELRALLSGWTLIGTNGFADGSISQRGDRKRQNINWRVYYGSGGDLRARFRRLGARQPHGALALRSYSSYGRWWIKQNWLCQAIDKWFYGGSVCFEIRRDGNELAMYYAECWGVPRCYRGRLGPQGRIRPGRHLN